MFSRKPNCVPIVIFCELGKMILMAHDKILAELAQLIAELENAKEAIDGAKSIVENVAGETATGNQKIMSALDTELFFMDEVIGSEDVSIILSMTQTNVGRLFNNGLLTPAKKIGRDWATTRSAVERYKENRVERRGNPWFGTIHKGRKPKGLDAAQDTLSAHEETETAHEFSGHEVE